MFTVAAGAAAAAATSANALWKYNRENYFFNRGLRQNRAHQVQNLRLAEAGLYREDMRDLFGLTVQKMDQYLIVNTLKLGFTISLFYDGRFPDEIEVHPWIQILYTLTLCGAIVFLLLSIWLAIHASVTAQAFVTKLLTGVVRLPIPSESHLTSIMGSAQKFERDCPRQLTLPTFFKKGMAESVEQRWEKFRSNDNYQTRSGEHIILYRDLAGCWQGWDAYARVCMSVGTIHVIQAIAFFAVGHFLIIRYYPLACAGVLVMMITIHNILISMDFLLSGRSRTVLFSIIVSVYLSVYITGVLNNMSYGGMVSKYACPFTFLAQLINLIAMWVALRPKKSNSGAPLPTSFRAVVTTDMFSDKFLDESNQRIGMDRLDNMVYQALGTKVEPTEQTETYVTIDDLQFTPAQQLIPILLLETCRIVAAVDSVLNKFIHAIDLDLLCDSDIETIDTLERHNDAIHTLLHSLPSASTVMETVSQDNWLYLKTMTSSGFRYVNLHTGEEQWVSEPEYTPPIGKDLGKVSSRSISGFHELFSEVQKQVRLLADLTLQELRGDATPEDFKTKLYETFLPAVERGLLVIRAPLRQGINPLPNDQVSDPEDDDIPDTTLASGLLRAFQRGDNAKTERLPWYSFTVSMMTLSFVWFCVFVWGLVSYQTEASIIASMRSPRQPFKFDKEKHAKYNDLVLQSLMAFNPIGISQWGEGLIAHDGYIGFVIEDGIQTEFASLSKACKTYDRIITVHGVNAITEKLEHLICDIPGLSLRLRSRQLELNDSIKASPLGSIFGIHSCDVLPEKSTESIPTFKTIGAKETDTFFFHGFCAFFYNSSTIIQASSINHNILFTYSLGSFLEPHGILKRIAAYRDFFIVLASDVTKQNTEYISIIDPVKHLVTYIGKVDRSLAIEIQDTKLFVLYVNNDIKILRQYSLNNID